MTQRKPRPAPQAPLAGVRASCTLQLEDVVGPDGEMIVEVSLTVHPDLPLEHDELPPAQEAAVAVAQALEAHFDRCRRPA